jgi:hypothetical protein
VLLGETVQEIVCTCGTRGARGPRGQISAGLWVVHGAVLTPPAAVRSLMARHGHVSTTEWTERSRWRGPETWDELHLSGPFAHRSRGGVKRRWFVDCAVAGACAVGARLQCPYGVGGPRKSNSTIPSFLNCSAAWRGPNRRARFPISQHPPRPETNHLRHERRFPRVLTRTAPDGKHIAPRPGLAGAAPDIFRRWK